MPKSCIETVFCTAQCKALNQRSKNKGALKFAMRTAVTSMFLVNVAGVVVLFYLNLHELVAQILFGVYCYMVLLTASSYIMVCVSDPGYVKRKHTQNMVRYCQTCKLIKPLRSHHCSQCGRCVLKMDHHCAWVATCIGAWNYGQFLQLLCASSVIFCYSSVLLLFGLIFKPRNESNAWMISRYCVCGFALLETAVFSVIVVKLFALHVKLVRSNQTTIEYFENQVQAKFDPQFKPPYSLGSASKNVREVLPHPLLGLIPFVKLKTALPFNGFYHFDPQTGKDYLSPNADKLALSANGEEQNQQDPGLDPPSASEDSPINVDLMTSRRSVLKSQLRLSQRLRNSTKLRKPVADGVITKLDASASPLSYEMLSTKGMDDEFPLASLKSDAITPEPIKSSARGSDRRELAGLVPLRQLADKPDVKVTDDEEDWPQPARRRARRKRKTRVEAATDVNQVQVFSSAVIHDAAK